MTYLKWLLILAVVAYGGLLALMYVFQRALMYFPDPTRVAPAQAGLPQAEEVALTSSDGEKLVAWYVAPRGDQPMVLYFQGNAEGLPARVNRFTWLTADGTGLLALCYRGYGGSTGTPTEDGLIRDAEAAYDFARARYPGQAHRAVRRVARHGGGGRARRRPRNRRADPRRAVHLRRRCRRRRLSVSCRCAGR